MELLKPCPNCNSNDIKDCYIYMECAACHMTGPKMNGGNFDDHADFVDRQNAIETWNNLPRRKS